MRLETWIVRSAISVSEAARQLDVSRQTVHAWLRKDCLPSVLHMVRIFAVTKGAVTLHDFDFAGEKRRDDANGLDRQENFGVERGSGRKCQVSSDPGYIRRSGAGI